MSASDYILPVVVPKITSDHNELTTAINTCSYTITIPITSTMELYLSPTGVNTTPPTSGYNIDYYAVIWDTGGRIATKNKIIDTLEFWSQDVRNAVIYPATHYFTNYYTYAPPLSTPIGLNATNITSDSALLGWAQNANASNFKIEYKINGDTSWTQTTSD